MSSDLSLRDALAQDRVMAIVRYRERGATEAVGALSAGGVRVLEVTVDSPCAWEAIETHASRSGLFVGAGTVTTTEEVRRVADLGGRFVVSPGFDRGVVETAHELGLASFPGVATGTEVLVARAAGVEFLKLFPAGALGTSYLRQLRGPFAGETFVPTGGIAVDDADAWFDAGAFAVALGGDLAGRAAPQTDADVEALTARAELAIRSTRVGAVR